ncbi:RagB/SusD family nutrient uptake outer membrane protein [Lepagella muris]|uniref:RagB/SusD family nutrient uptake outer membrane protein n=1 Tax=Lepagella muris TaxID=3032870 RepID=A0AC61RG82_9BACT|nr:RagB/SusD family nutrient uptake outer membrane protein [Lepagella muris]TGY78877.1 RagB/SusD family nutrient uptake outer membrane protein [Lepagella muris]THG52317.1 RagB/SusD family nutrient uptake outer membrane protein [Bacteroidales bacterium]TKC57948.1 RagB/SusD family nutrient uptake outer membrane protein [Bacteroidales bacterium]
MKKRYHILSLTASLLMLSSCDIEMVPKGQTTLETAQEIEYLLNEIHVSTDPGSDISILVNESYGQEFSTVKQLINNTNTLLSSYLCYNENLDRGNLASKDSRYTSIYSAINTLNVALGKIDAATGEQSIKQKVIAEAHLKRAYLHFLAANLYARQYDAATASQNGGIAYVDNYDMDQKQQIPLDQVYERILEDLDDKYIDALPSTASVTRCSRATGNAIKARILFQMKRYQDALPYALKALDSDYTIEDRLYMMDDYCWLLLPTSPNNFLYVASSNPSFWCPFADNLSRETVAKFEDGDLTIDYGYAGYKEEGEEIWNGIYGEMSSGVEGCLSFSGWDTYKNPWGLTVESIMYVAAECYIRDNQIEKGLGYVNEIREHRIDPEKYVPFTASTVKEAMEELQQAKFIEFLMTFENFFDRKRWNSEDEYKATITRDFPGIGTYSISPESPLWIMPFPIAVMQTNPTFSQNYE